MPAFLQAFCRRDRLAVRRGMLALLAWLWCSACAAAPGLTGIYYNNTTVSGTAALMRVDTTIAFDWASGSPGTGVNADGFSVRWSGVVRVATTGSYNFQTLSDDGVRLYVNNNLVINNWNDHPVTTDTSAAVTLTAGQTYPITMELYENTGLAVAQLNWKKPGDSAYTTIPADNGSLGLATANTLVTEYHFEESVWNGTTGELKDSASYASGPYNGKASGSSLPTSTSASPAISGDPGTCRFATMPGPSTGGSMFSVPSLPVSTTTGAQTSVSFWLYWNGTGTPIPVGWSDYVLWITNGYIGFNTNNGDIYGASSSSLANGWHHVVAVFTNGSVTSNRLYIDGVSKAMAQVIGSPNLSLAKVTTSMTLGGDPLGTGNRLTGRLDEVRIYNGALSATEVSADFARIHDCTALLVAEYKFEQASWAGTTGEVLDTSGNGYNGTAASLSATKPTTAVSSPAVPGSPGTCRYGNFTRANKDYVALPSTMANLGSTSSFTVTAWFRTTDRTQSGQRIFIDDENGWGSTSVGYILSLGDRGAGMLNFFTRAIGTTELTTSALVANNTWYFVAFGVDFAAKKKFIELRDVSGTVLASISNTYTATSIGTDSGIATIGGESNAAAGSENNSNFGFSGNIDEVRIYDGALSATEITDVQALRSTCTDLIDHLEIQHGSGSGLTCTPSTVTIRACQNADCSSLYTGGVTGTLTATGAGMTVNFPSGAAFSIPSGSSSVTEDIQLTTVGSVLLGTSGPSPTPNNPTTCNFGSPGCTYTAADAGLLFDVPNHRAEVANTVSVTAVKKADNSASCVPAFASVSKAVNFKCAYVNPTTGTQAVRVGTTALNSANNAGAACDATGQAVTLAFDGTGKANATVTYADAGTMTLTGTYTGSGSDAGLSMTGSDNFTAAPYTFAVTGPAAGNIVAGNNFAGSVAAKNLLGNTMPNFGRETTPEGATLGWVRTQPQGSAAVNGSFSGILGSFSGGTATSSSLKWSEVGRGELSAVLTSGSYLGSGFHVAGASNGSTWCADQLNNCVLPAGVTAVVYYGYGGWFNTRSNVTGTIQCFNGNFGDPLVGETRKFCSYVVTGGASAASTGSVGPFIPHHFDVVATPSCSGSFSYAGQPFTTTVTARNASNATTLNYDGSANTSPNFAKATTLADAPVLGLGSWSNSSIAVGAFAAGVATATPSYAFTTKTTAPQTLTVRATNSDGVVSSGSGDGAMPLRSGRLKLSNAFGSEKTSLAVPVQSQYWSGNAWVQNSADSCTTVPAAAVVRAAYADNRGAATTAWTSSVSAIAITGGAGTLTLGAPSPTSTGSVDFALNLGSTTTDASCLAAHPASTGAGLAWLRSQNGACAATWDRDPSARASFGIYVPETRKTIHVRELF